jgi:RHS repeat-associated protein
LSIVKSGGGAAASRVVSGSRSGSSFTADGLIDCGSTCSYAGEATTTLQASPGEYARADSPCASGGTLFLECAVATNGSPVEVDYNFASDGRYPACDGPSSRRLTGSGPETPVGWLGNSKLAYFGHTSDGSAIGLLVLNSDGSCGLGSATESLKQYSGGPTVTRYHEPGTLWGTHFADASQLVTGGGKVAYRSNVDFTLHIANSDGSGDTSTGLAYDPYVFSPSGNVVLAIDRLTGQLYLVPASGGNATLLALPSGASACLNDGLGASHFLYSDSAYYAVANTSPFHLYAVDAATGTKTQLALDTQFNGCPQVQAANGNLIVVDGAGNTVRTDRDGNVLGSVPFPFRASLSPDGLHVASISADQTKLLVDGSPVVDTGGASYIAQPILALLWSPDGCEIAYTLSPLMNQGNGDVHVVTVPCAPPIPNGQTLGDAYGNNPSASLSEPVNTATGAYWTRERDLQLPGIGQSFAVERSYSSLNAAVAGEFGLGWSWNYGAHLDLQPSGDVIATGPDGQQVTFTSNPDGSFTPAAGVTATLTLASGVYTLVDHAAVRSRFSVNGKLLALIDRNGNTISFGYDGNGRLQTISDSAGRQIGVSRNAANLISEISLPDGRHVDYAYTSGLLTTVTDANGADTHFSYDAGNRLVSTIDQNQHTLVTNTYDPSTGRVVEQDDARANKSYFSWDAASQTTTFTDARGKQWADVYSGNVLLSRSDPLGNTTRYLYDHNLDVIGVTDARNNTTTMSYDAASNMKSRCAPAPFSFCEQWTYDAFNNVKTATDGRGNTTSYGYDSAGNLTSITGADPDGAGPLSAPVTTITRDPAGTGLVTAIQDPRLKTTQYGHDSQGNLTSITTPLGYVTTLHYDGSGRVDYKIDPRGNVQGADLNQYKWLYTYSDTDELRTQTDPLGHVTSNDYYPDGSLQTATDPNGHQTGYSYWPSNQLHTVTGPDPDGAGPLTAPVTSYVYDAAGNLATRTDANQHVTSYGYDDAGRLTSVQTQLGKQTTYGYDAAGNLTSMVDGNGNATQTSGDGTTSYGYDNLNRLTSISYSDNPTTPNVNYTYDEDGNRKTMLDGAGTVSYVYDNLNELTSASRGSNTFAYTYDPAGNVSQRTYPDATLVSYGYDDDGRLQSVSNSGVGTVSYGYDAAANQTTTTLPAANGYVESRVYDRAGRLTEVKDAKGASTLSDFLQTLDPAGNPLTLTRTGSISQTASYGYDNLDRLTSVCFQTSCPNGSDPKIAWTYDGVGNRLTETRATSSTSYGYDGDDQLTQTTITPGLNPYSGQAVSDGAQPYWRFGEPAASSTFASTVGNYSGTWTGSPTLGAPGALNGDTNTADALTANTQVGTVPDASALSKTNNFSLELWVKRTKNAASQAVIGKPLTTTTKNENYAFWFDTSNKIRFEVGAGTKSATVTSAAALDTNWHHIVGSFASGTLKIYVDGALSASATASFTTATANTNSLNIGLSGTSDYNGSLDELALYNTALTATQVTDHYNKGHNAPPANTTTTYSYDNDGRQTTAGNNSYTWNLANRLTATTTGNQSSYGYDGDGNRLTTTAFGATTNQLWDTNYPLPQLALERDSANNLLRRYLTGTKTTSVSTTAGNFFYHYDPIGSVTNLTNASGATQWTYSYEPFGNTLTATQNSPTAPTNPTGFTGQSLDPTSNLYNLRARQYDTKTGRFLTTDPHSPPTTTPHPSAYLYATDNPTSLVDPSGMDSDPAGSADCGWAGHTPLIGGNFCTGFQTLSPNTQGLLGAWLDTAPVALTFLVGGGLAANAAEEGSGLTRVGRWMSEDEFAAMEDAGRVQEGAGGRTYVVHPPNPDAYTGAAPGSVYAEFDVPTSSLRPASKPEWRQIIGPNIETRLFGPPPSEMPRATNICLVCRK